MGPGVLDVPDGEGGGGGAVEEASACSICLEAVKYGANRSTAKLQCGHDFHLDCIGSAFNAKGMMQCPNCRKIEKGNWLYGNGFFFPVFNTNEWRHDEELYDFNYLEMPYGVRWCPVSRTARDTSTFGDGESVPSVFFQDIAGHHVIFTEIPSISFVARPCPHFSYIHPLHLPSLPTPYSSSDGAVDTNFYHRQWSPAVLSTEDSVPHSLHSNEALYYGWEHHSSSFSQPRNVDVASNQASVSHVPRNIRLDNSDPYTAGSLVHSFVGRHRSSAFSVQPYSSTGQAPANLHEIHQQRHISNEHQTSLAGLQRSRAITYLPFRATDHSSFYISPSPNPFYGNHEDAMSTRNQFHVSERVHQYMPFTVHPFASAATGFRRRHASQRQLPQARDDSPPYRLPPGPFV